MAKQGPFLLTCFRDGEGSTRRISDFSEFTALVSQQLTLQKKEVDWHRGIVLRKDNVELIIGLGDSQWTLTQFVREDGDVPSEQSVGIGNARAKGVEKFVFEQYEELPRKELLPRAIAEQAVQVWMQSGQLTSKIKWKWSKL